MNIDDLYKQLYNNYSYCTKCKKKTKDTPTMGSYSKICKECRNPKGKQNKGCK